MSSLLKTNDLIAVGLSVAYDVGIDYKKVMNNPMVVVEKTAYQVGGKLLQPMVGDFLPNFMTEKDKDFLYFGSNQEHLATGLLCMTHLYWGKKRTLQDSIQQGAVEALASYAGNEIRKSLSQNPNVKLKDEIII
jgi:hypothetical protein